MNDYEKEAKEWCNRHLPDGWEFLKMMDGCSGDFFVKGPPYQTISGQWQPDQVFIYRKEVVQNSPFKRK